MLKELVGLARESSSKNRRQLLRRIADHFVEESDDYSDRELRLFGQVMSKLLGETDIQSRAEVSELISRDTNTPRDITLRLANDEIEVARPILKNSPNLTANDLQTLVGGKSVGHRIAISHRSDLNEDITDELIRHSECEVLRAVSGNMKAPISDWGYGAIAEHVPDDLVIQNNLTCRTDMSLAAAINVLPLLATHAQQKLTGLIKEGLIEGDSEELTALVGQAVHDTAIKNIENVYARIDAQQLAAQVRTGELGLDNVISELAKDDRPADCAIVLSICSEIPEAQVSGNLLKINGEGIALLCKSIGVGRQAFHDLALMRCNRLKLPSSKADELALAYEDLDGAIAQRTLRFVKVRTTTSRTSSAA